MPVVDIFVVNFSLLYYSQDTTECLKGYTPGFESPSENAADVVFFRSLFPSPALFSISDLLVRCPRQVLVQASRTRRRGDTSV